MFERRLFREEHDMFRDTVRKFVEREIAGQHFLCPVFLCDLETEGSQLCARAG